MNKDYEIKFVIDGKECGSSHLSVINGELSTEAAEEEFYATLRKNTKSLLKDAEETEREYIIDNLTHDQEEKLREKHAENYNGTDDYMSDAYEDWLIELSLDELKEILFKRKLEVKSV